ncbi:Cation efflux system protein CzcA [Ewingella americana]|uniref:Cation efflux system protein CzcA n=1 Tax=Ewingella americana TaxID=41202 RepID=A0A377NER4_9GAMM|nr:Cation efflux system protein CzcA [Ewingella americana]
MPLTHKTRTFEARYVLQGESANAPLGSTVTLNIGDGNATDPQLQVPIAAIYDAGKGPGVWAISGKPEKVSWQPVQVLGLTDEVAKVAGPLQAGERIVALGAHLLHEGEAVRTDLPTAAGASHEWRAFNLSALAVRERSITLFLIILITLAGVVSFLQLGRAEDPPFTVKQMTIITAWPGATAQEMQDQVAEPLEKRMQELKWYDRTETYTRAGLAYTTLSLLDSTPPDQVPEEFYQARKKIGDEAQNLPSGVIGPVINDEFSDVTFALFALKAQGEPQRLLVRDAESLRQRLLHVPGVKKVNIIGERPERIFVSFSHDRLATLGISPQDIFSALNSQNVLTPAGSIDTSGPQVFLRLDGAFDKLEKIRNTPIITQGRTLKLSDVATVERGYEDPATFKVRNQGEPALLLGVVMRDGWNGLDLGKSLDAETAKINQDMPLGHDVQQSQRPVGQH